MKRAQKEIVLADLMPRLIRTRLGKRYWDFHKLSSAWQEVAGEHVAAQARPAWIRKNTLWLHVHSPAWSQEIQLIKPQLLDKIRQYLPDAGIEDIRCLQAPAKTSDNDPPAKRPDPAPDMESKKKHIRNLTKSLPDARAGKALYAFWKKVQGIEE